ncbi:exodeoxyribonuclease V subunit alpha [Photobacterium sp. GB-50]|uniref:exodeoxyribonuclease V subunit alpha n=1 Tax=unclassified Photobacterium TaxID=2628852 RepID=UPI000D166FDE|nr:MULTISPECIES: exodeoxyribonuclease V subunit alpha [unclassified Photobacterium]PSV55610.1 exodeoxyribonuclease V subunit alpha [Photobacterium sp. GB-3]PSW72453.1 exodeoxyribonuclease V subunit alpha [Photobacterium sp. GB-50]
MLKRLQALTKQGVLRQLDYQFAKFVAHHSPADQADLAALVAALASNELGKGHVCVVLDTLSLQRLFSLPSRVAIELLEGVPEPSQWGELLSHFAVVSSVQTGKVQATPLVIEHGRLYLSRYWQFEQTVANKILMMANNAGSEDVRFSTTELNVMHQALDDLFPVTYGYLYEALSTATTADARQRLVCDMLDVVKPEQVDWAKVEHILVNATSQKDLSQLDGVIPLDACLNWQKVAAAVALTRQFAVISGGPGTGKTTTVAKLLAALVMQAGDEHVPNIMLVAPTGKAAARLTESISSAVKSLPVAASVKERIPTQSSTIHRLLGAIPGRVEFRHHKDNPLHLDVLVVDEASMVDLPMMARLLDAMPAGAKLILLGDRDQLASVEAGAVLGDICSFANQGYSGTQGQVLSQLTGYDLHSTSLDLSLVADCLCMLQKSYRFHAQSGIGQLAKAINSGRPALVEKVWQQGFKDIHHYALSSDSYQSMINQVTTFYFDYLDAIAEQREPKLVLDAFANVRLLCALREGDFGVVGLNYRIEKELTHRGKINPGDDTWYQGRPIMITRNDHAVGLYNGDIGITMLEPETDAVDGVRRLKVYFEMPDGTIRGFLPSRIPEHEVVYAMTIHKSQGSEFADTVMVLPNDFTPILTRELIYTGITRAKARLYLYAQPDVIRRSVQVRTERASGLSELLV